MIHFKEAFRCDDAGLQAAQNIFNLVARKRDLANKNGETDNIINVDLAERGLSWINSFAQTFMLRPAGQERADMGNHLNLTEDEANFVLAEADHLHLLGGQKPADPDKKIDLAVILGSTQPSVQKRIDCLKAYMQEHPGIVQNVIAAGADRKLWLYDGTGQTKDPIGFDIIAKRLGKNVEEVQKIAKVFVDNMSAETKKDVKKIANEMASRFREEYNLENFPTESDMITELLQQDPYFAGKVKVQTALAGDKPRATTYENAKSIAEILDTEHKEKQHVCVVSQDSFACYQGDSFIEVLSDKHKVSLLATKLSMPTTKEEKIKQATLVIDSFARAVYQKLALWKQLEKQKKKEQIAVLKAKRAAAGLSTGVKYDDKGKMIPGGKIFLKNYAQTR